MSFYRASADLFVNGLTAGLVVILAVVVISLGAAFAAIPNTLVRAIMAFGILICVAIPVGAYLWGPRGYELTATSLVVHRPIGDVDIPLSTMRGARLIDRFMGLSLKTFPGGNSGLFGMYGTFYNSELGHFHMYSQRASKLVVIETTGRPIVISPDDRDRFVSDLQERLRAIGVDAAPAKETPG
jgi:Bacterial PH domain